GGASGTSATIVVNPPATQSFLIAAPGNAVAGTQFTVVITAKAGPNGTGATVSNYNGTVVLTSDDPIAVLPPGAVVVLTNGSGTFPVTMKTVGTRHVTGKDQANNTITGVSNDIIVGPGNATKFDVAVPVPANPAVAKGVAFNFTVIARDAFGNIASGYGG